MFAIKQHGTEYKWYSVWRGNFYVKCFDSQLEALAYIQKREG